MRQEQAKEKEYKLYDRRGMYLATVSAPLNAAGRAPGLIKWDNRYFFLYVGEYTETDCFEVPQKEF